jgi:hypothetical protein
MMAFGRLVSSLRMMPGTPDRQPKIIIRADLHGGPEERESPCPRSTKGKAMNSHLNAELMNSRLAQIEAGAERHRREGNIASRPRRFAVKAVSLRPTLRLRPARHTA